MTAVASSRADEATHPHRTDAASRGAVVYLVDDDPRFQDSLRFLMESVGLRVRAFPSAQEFLDGFDPNVPGCLVLDVRMPGMSGLELQEQLNQLRVDLPI